MTSGEKPQSGGSRLGKRVKGLLLTGEGITAMAHDELRQFRRIIGDLGLRLTAISDLEAVEFQVAQGSESIPATRADFLDFATHHYSGSSRQGSHAWTTVVHTERRSSFNRGDDPYPSIRYISRGIGSPDYVNPMDSTAIIDLASVAGRLASAGEDTQAWAHPSEDAVHFLIHLTNEKTSPAYSCE